MTNNYQIPADIDSPELEISPESLFHGMSNTETLAQYFNRNEGPEPIHSPQRLQKLGDRHKMMAQMQLQGKSASFIADSVGCHEQRVYQIRTDPLYVTYLNELRKEVRENAVFDLSAKLKEAEADTFNTIYELMKYDENSRVRLSAAIQLFDRQMPKVNKIEAKNDLSIFIESNTVKEAFSHFAEAGLLRNTNPESADDAIDLLEREIDELASERLSNGENENQ